MWCASCCASCLASCTCGLCMSAASGISQRSARIAYCGLFGLSLIVSWILREVAVPLLKNIPWINTFSDPPSDEWFQADAVLRVSLGNFLFFIIFAFIMIGIKDQNDRRDSWHHGGWPAKIVVWALLVVLMFFVPNGVIGIYESLSKFGSGLFLLIQVILLLDFTHTWNDSWVEKDEQKWYIALLVISVVCYLATYSVSGLLFFWFNPSGYDCGLNIFFIVMTMILAFIFAVVALHPKVNGSLLPASVISAYCTYLCYSGLSSEPRDYECNGLHNHSKAVSTGTLILGMLTTVLSVLYSAVRAGSSTAFLSPSPSSRPGIRPSISLLACQMEASTNFRVCWKSFQFGVLMCMKTMVFIGKQEIANKECGCFLVRKCRGLFFLCGIEVEDAYHFSLGCNFSMEAWLQFGIHSIDTASLDSF